MKKIILAIAIPFLFTGCASVINETSHPMKIDTKTADGKVIMGADCKVTNEYGSVNGKSGEAIKVRRSDRDLEISCTYPDTAEARGRAISRVNGGMFGNIIIGGGIGAVIDHSRGTAYTYPTWVQLVFGKVLSFDRRAEKDGEPVPAVELSAPTAAK